MGHDATASAPAGTPPLRLLDVPRGAKWDELMAAQDGRKAKKSALKAGGAGVAVSGVSAFLGPHPDGGTMRILLQGVTGAANGRIFATLHPDTTYQVGGVRGKGRSIKASSAALSARVVWLWRCTQTLYGTATLPCMHCKQPPAPYSPRPQGASCILLPYSPCPQGARANVYRALGLEELMQGMGAHGHGHGHEPADAQLGPHKEQHPDVPTKGAAAPSAAAATTDGHDPDAVPVVPPPLSPQAAAAAAARAAPSLDAPKPKPEPEPGAGRLF